MGETVFEEYITVIRRNYITKNDVGKIIQKDSFQIKGMFLEKLAGDAFSGTNGEDAVEHIEKFLKIMGPINMKDINHGKL